MKEWTTSKLDRVVELAVEVAEYCGGQVGCEECKLLGCGVCCNRRRMFGESVLEYQKRLCVLVDVIKKERVE